MRAAKPFLLISGFFAAILAVAPAPASYASTPENQVEQPVISASDGTTTCKPAQTVAISDATEGASIYYTTDGSAPSTSSVLYSVPVTLTGTQILRAKAFAVGYQQSKTVTATAGKLLACDDKITISSGGLSRTFLIHVPASYEARTQTNPSPLLLDLHGYQAGETSDEVVAFEVQHSGEKEMSDKRGFIAIWPEATDINGYHSWAGVYCCTPALGTVDDVSFLRQVITWGETYGVVDTNRIYVAGFSNGSQMAHRMACDASDVVTAVAAVSWPINEGADQCKITRPMPMMEVHGTADKTIYYYGNTVPPKTYSDPPITISAPAGAEVWRQINQCDTSTPPETVVTANGIKYTGETGAVEPDRITQIRGKNCKNGVYTGLISVYNQPHVVFDALQADKFNIAQYFWNTIFDKP